MEEEDSTTLLSLPPGTSQKEKAIQSSTLVHQYADTLIHEYTNNNGIQG